MAVYNRNLDEGFLMTMLHPSTKKLIDKLSEMTRRQRVSWLQGEDGRIYHDTEGFRVVLTPAPHQVLITDALGKAIETAADDEFAGVTDAHNRPYAMFVGELYREADRCARGAERAIDLLLKGLDRPDESEAPAPAAPGIDAAPEDLADELASTDDLMTGSATQDVQGITNALATMADEINAAADTAEPAALPVSPGAPAQWIPVAGSALLETVTAEPAETETSLALLEALAEPIAPAPVAEAPAPPSESAAPALAQGYEEADLTSGISDAERLEFDDLKTAELELPHPSAPGSTDSVLATPQPAPPVVPEPAAAATPAPAPTRYAQFGNYGRPFAPPAPATPPVPVTPPAPPVAEITPLPEVEATAPPPPMPPPVPAPSPIPATQQRFSLSGLGVGAAGARAIPPATPLAPPPETPAPPAPPVAASGPPAAPVVTPPAPAREEAFEFSSLSPVPEPAEPVAEAASRPLFRSVDPGEAAPEEKVPETAGDAQTSGRPRRFNPWQ